VAAVIVLAHALLGIIFFGGLFGRGIVLALAERADSLPEMLTLTKAARPFERIVIVIGAIAGVLGVGAAIAQGRPFLGPLQGAGVDWLFVSVLLVVTTFPLPPLVFLPRGLTGGRELAVPKGFRPGGRSGSEPPRTASPQPE